MGNTPSWLPKPTWKQPFGFDPIKEIVGHIPGLDLRQPPKTPPNMEVMFKNHTNFRLTLDPAQAVGLLIGFVEGPPSVINPQAEISWKVWMSSPDNEGKLVYKMEDPSSGSHSILNLAWNGFSFKGSTPSPFQVLQKSTTSEPKATVTWVLQFTPME